MYKTDLGSVASPAKQVAIVMVGFKCPPDAGAAENIKRLRPMVLVRAAYSVLANIDCSEKPSPFPAAPTRKMSRQVPAKNKSRSTLST